MVLLHILRQLRAAEPQHIGRHIISEDRIAKNTWQPLQLPPGLFFWGEEGLVHHSDSIAGSCENQSLFETRNTIGVGLGFGLEKGQGMVIGLG